MIGTQDIIEHKKKEEIFKSKLLEIDSDNKKWKAKCSDLQNKIKELLRDNTILSKSYIRKTKFAADEPKAKAKADENVN